MENIAFVPACAQAVQGNAFKKPQPTKKQQTQNLKPNQNNKGKKEKEELANWTQQELKATRSDNPQGVAGESQ